jgi:hypothetical protein
MSTNGPLQQSNVISLADEERVKEVPVNSILGLWDVVNNLTRLRPSRKDRYRADRSELKRSRRACSNT